jgi:uncharacterized protein
MQPWSQFENQSYLSLETFKKSGQGVATPVWFARSGEVLYVKTEAQSGKAKRIRNGGHVRIAPCDSRGKLKGAWTEATAVLVDATEAAQAEPLLNRKYGLLKRGFDLMGKVNRSEYVTIRILPRHADT